MMREFAKGLADCLGRVSALVRGGELLQSKKKMAWALFLFFSFMALKSQLTAVSLHGTLSRKFQPTNY